MKFFYVIAFLMTLGHGSIAYSDSGSDSGSAALEKLVDEAGSMTMAEAAKESNTTVEGFLKSIDITPSTTGLSSGAWSTYMGKWSSMTVKQVVDLIKFAAGSESGSSFTQTEDSEESDDVLQNDGDDSDTASGSGSTLELDTKDLLSDAASSLSLDEFLRDQNMTLMGADSEADSKSESQSDSDSSDKNAKINEFLKDPDTTFLDLTKAPVLVGSDALETDDSESGSSTYTLDSLLEDVGTMKIKDYFAATGTSFEDFLKQQNITAETLGLSDDGSGSNDTWSLYVKKLGSMTFEEYVKTVKVVKTLKKSKASADADASSDEGSNE